MKILFVTYQAETNLEFDWHFTRENLRGQGEVQVDKLSGFLLNGRLNLANLRSRARWIARLIRVAGRYDFIVCRENSIPTRLVCVLKRLGLIRSAKLALTELSFNQGTGFRSRLAMLFTRISYSAADIVLVLSRSQLEYFKKNALFGKRTKLVHAPLSIAAPTLEFVAQKAKNASAYPIGEGFVFTIGLSHRDFPLLIAAAAAFPEMQFIIMTKSAICDLPLNVSLAEWGPFEEYVAYLQGASLIAIPLTNSDHDSGLGVLFEAWALGKPALIAKTPRISEYVNPEVAFTYRPGNLESLKDALRQALADPERRDMVGGKAYLHLLQNHSSKVYLAHLIHHLREISPKR